MHPKRNITHMKEEEYGEEKEEEEEDEEVTMA